MSFHRSRRGLPGWIAALMACVLTLGSPAVQAQTRPAGDDTPATASTREITIAPNARDTQIADRLERILVASDWFPVLAVSVREGIVFLDGVTETEDRRDWAQSLALRTQDVVAVVNRIEVRPTISWDLTPTWRELGRLADRAQWFAPLTVVSLIILLVFWMLSRGVAALTRHALRRRIMSPLLVNIAARAISLPVMLVGFYLVLQLAGLTRLAVTVLGGTGLIGIVVGLAFREIAENWLASILLSVHNPFRTGDWIQVGGHEGIVQNLNMRTTILLTLDGNHVLIPNSMVFKSVVKNFSTNPNRRTEFTVGIGYDDPIVRAQDVILDTLRAHPAVLDAPEPAAIVEELGASTVNIRVQFWFSGKTYSIFKVRSSLMRQVKRALQDAGISMPDAAREIIFPEGVPLRRASTGAATIQDRPRHEVASDSAAAKAEATAEALAEAATVTSGEGTLKSEEGALKQQAKASALPGGEKNLLDANSSAAGHR